MTRHITSLLALFGFVILAGGSFSDDKEEDEKVENSASVAEVTATELFEAYEANEVAADDEYKDKVLEVSGVVDSIGKDILDEMYVSLEASPMFGVQAFFSESKKGQLKSLSKGQSVTLKCRCEGKMANVLLKNCSIVE